MDRRTAIRNIALATGSVTLLTRCGFGEERLPIALNNLKVSVEQEDLLKEIVSVIIPQTDLPGAESLEVHNFVWVMADDCMDVKDQDRFMNGIGGVNKLLKHTRGQSFSEIEPAVRSEVLTEIVSFPADYAVPEDREGNPEFNLADIQYFVGQTKRFTIEGFMDSEYIMTEVMPYKLVPGPASGCLKVDPAKRINING
ncbi:gluconate 2-dehydrogenase subunit 3 family protein [Fulvivirga sedimenti]|uniref:Gluconate 2-dehydrogenase subunit 3 family protein n=1 Tax=Fulvivirga sedimenti TaxID=2879465 RepID=A0A9X1HT86_9BACT|nr:gluconate 2-dehydrogenase subunit 3 family protein [Fulvivirga sedimenti]MCA6074827.1 gluconate 2-dehydrogenase subunit 3 family protein [Fulvivirga sedimenti]MCA6076004.1 gluconate 2-dehydrogenase subunit 3 family protein [Fulvivirga sedimenti]MCA6077132.1 gluconate 2-dehydrogenase subunit 3 family protein [Fulvivirga sedimenti]